MPHATAQGKIRKARESPPTSVMMPEIGSVATPYAGGIVSSTDLANSPEGEDIQGASVRSSSSLSPVLTRDLSTGHSDLIPSETTDTEISPSQAHRCSTYAFLDTASDSEYSIDEEKEPTIGRASSVRVSKPQIVQHRLTGRTRFTIGKNELDNVVEEATIMSGGDTKTLCSDQPSSSKESKTPTVSRNSLECTLLQNGNDVGTAVSSRDDSSGTVRYIVTNDTAENSLSALPTGDTFQSVHPIIEDSRSPMNEEKTLADIGNTPTTEVSRTLSSTLPLPGKGLSRRVTIRPTDLVIKGTSEQTWFRENVVTTPYPAHEGSNTSSSSNSSVNESEKTVDHINTTYRRSEEEILTTRPNGNTRGRVRGKNSVSFINPTTNMISVGAKDRFPSPERSETLFLDLCLLRHPCARTTIEIQIANKGTFDDELLFRQIQAAYSKQLIGPYRRVFRLLRRVGYVSVTAPSTFDATEFKNIDFLKHLHSPRLGRKRKAWVIWLRNNNPRSPARTTAPVPSPPPGAYVRQINDLNRLSLRTQRLSLSHGQRGSRVHSHDHNRSHHTEKTPVAGLKEMDKRFSTASDASSFNFVYSPAVARLPFLASAMHAHASQSVGGHGSPTVATRGNSPCRSFFWPNNLSSALSTSTRMGMGRASSSGDEDEASRIVTISCHHEFRIGAVALLTLLVVLQAVFVALIWVLFGVPGTRPGNDGQLYGVDRIGGIVLKSDWRVDAKARVLTGVVIGLTLFLIGCLVEGALVWGSWVLL